MERLGDHLGEASGDLGESSEELGCESDLVGGFKDEGVGLSDRIQSIVSCSLALEIRRPPSLFVRSIQELTSFLVPMIVPILPLEST